MCVSICVSYATRTHIHTKTHMHTHTQKHTHTLKKAEKEDNEREAL